MRWPACVPSGSPDWTSSPLAVTKSRTEVGLLRQVSPVEGTLAKDEVQNELVLKTHIAQLMLDNPERLSGDRVVELTQVICAAAQ